MTDYNTMSAAARFQRLEWLARQVYGAKWKGKIAAEYGVSPQSVTNWKNKGAPVYIVTALDYQHEAMMLAQVKDAIMAVRVGGLPNGLTQS